MTPDLPALEAFVAAAETLHFGRAAKRMALSPQALSGRIKQLEIELDAPLFIRTTRSVELTPGGQRLLPHARELLQSARVCADVVRSPQGLSFELTIGTRFELGLSWLTPSLSTLRTNNPRRHLHLSFGDGPVLMKRVVAGEIDAAVTSSRIEAVPVDYQTLHEERYVFVGSAALMAKRSLCSNRDASAFTLLDERADQPLFRYLRDASSRDERWSFANVEHLGTIGAIRIRALAGAGVAVLPAYFVRADLERGGLVQLLPKRRLLSDHFRLVWRRNHPLRSELETLGVELQTFPLT